MHLRHFSEDEALYAVESMENEDGTKGPHWTVEETTSIANQLGINLKSGKHNKWDWFVAMNMIYSDFYRAIIAIAGKANVKYFAELAKAWLCDKDAPEDKLWLYYKEIMRDEDDMEDTEYEEFPSHNIRGRNRLGNYERLPYSRYMHHRPSSYYEDEERIRLPRTTYVRYY